MAGPGLDELIRELAAIERPSGSDGERRAAEWLAGKLRAAGCEVALETHPVHGNFWRPIGVLGALAAAAGASRSRALATLVGTAAAVALRDEIDDGSYRFRNALGRRRTAWNVVAETSDRDAQRTLVVMAHHDAAQSGIVFHPGPQRWVGTRFPEVIERNDTALAMWWPAVAGPALVALGGLTGRRRVARAGAALSAGLAGLMADIGRRPSVPGASDNATGVAVLVALAHRLRERPVPGLRVMLLSAGAEETLQEGIRGFAAKHFPHLPTATTAFLNVDTLGSPELTMLEGEGPFVMREYDAGMKDLVAACAAGAGLSLRRGMRARTSTDGVVPMRGGYPTATIVSLNEWKALDNYHWPTDVPENVNLGTVEHALALAEAVTRELGKTWLR